MSGLANAAAAPMNAVGRLWGDKDLGEQSLGYKTLKSFTPDAPKPGSPLIAAPTIDPVAAQQRRSSLVK
jgi:hypothetical protein